MYYVIDVRDREPRRSYRAQGPYESEDAAQQLANSLNDFIMRNAGLRPKFRVVPASEVRPPREDGSVLVVNGADL